MIVVGLGNPEQKYANTRHNIGRMVVQKAIQEFSPEEETGLIHLPGLSYVVTKIADRYDMLAFTEINMNESGLPVECAIEAFGHLFGTTTVIVHDDLDLPYGKIRVKGNGGDGGHNGLKSITEHLGTHEYLRLKIGIGRPPTGMRVYDYVLGDFTNEEMLSLEQIKLKGVKALEILLNGESLAQVQQVINAKNLYNKYEE